MSGNKNEHARLFDVGLDAGRKFLNAVKNGQLTRKELDEEVPIGVTTLLQGPSTDFIVGQIFGSAASNAYDQVVREKNGIPLDPSEWITNEEHKTMKAQAKYLHGNCAILK